MRRGMTRGGGLVSAVLGLVLVLSACTTSAEVETEPTSRTVVPTVEPTPTPTPTPTPDIAPEAVRPERPEYEVSEAAAEAFAEYFLLLYPYVYASGDLTEWNTLIHPECVFCRSVVDNVTAQVQAGNTSSGGLVTIGASRGRKISENMYIVDVEISQAASEERGPDGTVVDSAEPSTHTISVVLLPEAGAWVVRAVQVDEPPDA